MWLYPSPIPQNPAVPQIYEGESPVIGCVDQTHKSQTHQSLRFHGAETNG